MNIGGHDIGVCSWSLRPADMAELAATVRQLGLDHVQLALGPLLAMDEEARQRELAALRESGLILTATMISFTGEDYSSIAAIRETGGYCPEKLWDERRQLTLDAGRLTKELGVRLLTTHVGFIPPSSSPRYQVMLARIGELATSLGDMGIELTMETGQENAAELLQFINDMSTRNVHVNFDPANMILYGAGDPVDAIRTLGRHIRHVHVKDATRSAQPGVQWGEEVPFGTGVVNVKEFLAALHDVGYAGPLVIEREAGNNRVQDVRTAIRTLQTAAE
jgi:sugar phosphate isomerase/epimerase